jgi:hypothetical protein
VPFAATGYLVICVLFGVGAVFYGIRQKNRVEASQSWLSAMGTITSAQVVQNLTTDSVEYNVLLRYEYVVNGIGYSGQRIGFNSRAYLRKKGALAQLERYPVNSQIMVYFDPQKPADSVLVREAPFSTLYVALGIGSLAVAAGIFVLTELGVGR